MTRLYIELSPEDGEPVPKSVATKEYVMKKAREIMHPFRLEWVSVGTSKKKKRRLIRRDPL